MKKESLNEKALEYIGQYFGDETRQMYSQYYNEKNSEEMTASLQELMLEMTGTSKSKKIMAPFPKFHTSIQSLTKGNRSLISILSLLLGGAALIYFFSIGFPWGNIVRQLTYLLLSAIPVAGALYAARFYGIYGRQGEVFGIFLFAFSCFFIGELIWTFLLLSGLDPFPSQADYFYLLFYPLLFFGLIKELKILHFNWAFARKAFSFLALLLALILMGLVGYFGVYLAYHPEVSLLENVVAISYGIGDVILIFLAFGVLRMACVFRGGQIFSSWLAFSAALFATLLGDIGFAVFNEAYGQENLWVYFSLDGLWILSFLLFGYTLFSLGSSVRRARQRIEKFLN